MSDEQETLDRLKEWWDDNGWYVIAGLVLGVAGMLGWQQWNAWQDRVAEQASIVYLQMSQAMDANRRNEALQLAEQLAEDYARTPYADQALLRVARMHADRGEPADAAEALRRLIDNTRDRELRSLAALRLARVLYHEGRYDDALAALDTVGDRGFGARAAELRGDVLNAAGDPVGARQAYQQALAHPDQDLIDLNLVRVKLDDLPSAAVAGEDGP